ncbi:Uncharacterised protein [Burkholderia pseudomallei]|uniref:hypothetical protein n=1 Tax=Burkholderia pseudomallei TaxID=28450 RepID=UPI0005E31473|nr:hypothetical protein [Burkholderia pseudomallei]CAK1332253.1 Uncharacterised protein [Burkholderia pseudomallei]
MSYDHWDYTADLTYEYERKNNEVKDLLKKLKSGKISLDNFIKLLESINEAGIQSIKEYKKWCKKQS